MRRPEKCPKCGDPNNIGWLNSIDAENDQEYEDRGGLYYCVTCAWGEDESIFPKCSHCQQPLRTKEDQQFAENQEEHPGVLGRICPECYNKECEAHPDTPWTDPISGEIDFRGMGEDLGISPSCEDEILDQADEELFY